MIEKMDMLRMDHEFAGRYLNDGFSGGEEARRGSAMAVLELNRHHGRDRPGLDIDALRIVSEGVNPSTARTLACWSSHYQRILNYIKPQFVHIMMDGQIVESGGPDLALHLEEHGYDWLREKQNGNGK